MGTVSRLIVLPPRKVLVVLLVIYAVVDFFSIRSMVTRGEVYVAALFFAVLATWGLVGTLLHPLLWKAAPASLAEDSLQGVVLKRTRNDRRRDMIAAQARGMLSRPVLWPMLIMVVASCCCCIPGDIIMG